MKRKPDDGGDDGLDEAGAVCGAATAAPWAVCTCGACILAAHLIGLWSCTSTKPYSIELLQGILVQM